jgi:hypothetical protein
LSKPSPALFQIISTDYLAQNFFVMIFGGWVIFVVDAAFAGGFTRFLAVFAAALTLLGALTFFWRYRLIVSTFANGAEIPGRIIEISAINKDYVVRYEYDFKDQSYQCQNRVKRQPYAEKLKPNQQVVLLAHERTPHIAFIKDLYLEYLK